MDQSTKKAAIGTPKKDPQGVRSNASENSNPNFKGPSPNPKCLSSTQLLKSPAKPQKSAAKKTAIYSIASPRNRLRERKFVVAKKKTNNEAVKTSAADPDCKCKDKANGKCLCVAYEKLRASQEEFFKHSDIGIVLTETSVDGCKSESEIVSQDLLKGSAYSKDGDKSTNLESVETAGNQEPEASDSPEGVTGNSSIKRRRDMLMEEARQSVPERGSGRVMHLVHAFERLLTIPKSSEAKDEKEIEEHVKKGTKWALPGLQMPEAPKTDESSSPFCPEEFFCTAESLGLRPSISVSTDSGQGSGSRRSSNESFRSRRRRSGSISSTNVGGRKGRKKQPKVTCLEPFKLRTEERGKMKEEEFFKKLHEMMNEEEKRRIPIAQGLPWTTDEPECLIKPPVKESTRPVDLKLHTDIRAVERSEFDHQVNEKLMLMEQYRLERERQLKLAEEEEIRRLRKELVPVAQPMPYFDRPFIPKRSEKQPTIPREPKFHLPQQQHKKMKSCLSWNDFGQLYTQLQ